LANNISWPGTKIHAYTQDFITDVVSHTCFEIILLKARHVQHAGTFQCALLNDDVSQWNESKKLQLNVTKTVVIWCFLTHRQHQILVDSLMYVGSLSAFNQIWADFRYVPFLRGFFYCQRNIFYFKFVVYFFLKKIPQISWKIWEIIFWKKYASDFYRKSEASFFKYKKDLSDFFGNQLVTFRKKIPQIFLKNLKQIFFEIIYIRFPCKIWGIFFWTSQIKYIYLAVKKTTNKPPQISNNVLVNVLNA